jgi:hypothetical protein
MFHRSTSSTSFAPTVARALFMALFAPILAHASCEPIVAAYTKAEATGRYALFDVSSINAPAKGTPFQITVGNDGYIDAAGNSGTYQKTSAHIAASEGRSLEDREKQGKVRCESLGERKIGSESASGYAIRSTEKGNAPDPMAIHMWISRATGLPVFHGMGSDDGGLHWVFGSAVALPAADKIKR